MRADRVLTINDYYDGPRLGIAELDGVPYIYEAEHDHSTEHFGDTYYLSPVDSDLLVLVLEDWKIFERWDAAFRAKQTSEATHPALPHERARHDELKIAIGTRLRTDPENRVYARGIFGRSAPDDTWQGTTVAWTRIDT